MKHLSYIELNSRALKSNLRSLRRNTPNVTTVIAVVKANAYGHGLTEIVNALDGQVDYFGVDDLDELVQVRRSTNSSVFVLGYVPQNAIGDAISLNAELAIYDIERLPIIEKEAIRVGKKARVHLKIDALLGRQGVLPSELPEFLKRLKAFDNIEVVTAYSHFANIEDTVDPTHANAQSAVFDACFDKVANSRIEEIERHESATSGAMVYEPRSKNKWVRFGIGMYGLYPSTSLAQDRADLEFEPVLKWVSHLAQIKRIPTGHPVGYGLTWEAKRETLIGIVPQGYSDGLDRKLSNCGEVLIGGKRCSIIGRVAMNMLAIDLTNAVDACVEDEVVLIGSQGSERISCEEVAAHIGSINYEVVARISPLLPRVVV